MVRELGGPNGIDISTLKHKYQYWKPEETKTTYEEIKSALMLDVSGKEFKLNDKVIIKLPSFQGEGKIKGISTSLPIVGHIYIVECLTVYNEVYPYECICVPEIYLSRVLYEVKD